MAGASWTASCRISEPNDPNTPRTAEVYWQATIPALGPPAIDDQSVFFALRDHRIAAIDRANGQQRWVFRSGQSGDNLITQDTPVRATDVVVFGDWDLYGLDPATGSLRWVFPAASGDQLSFGSGVYPFKSDGARIYAGSVIGAAFAIDGVTGAQIWRADLFPGNDQQVRVLAIQGGLVYLTVKYNGPRYSGRAYALRATSGVTVWSFELPRADGSSNGTADGILTAAATNPLFVVSFNDGRIVGLDALTGSPRWTIPRLATLTTTDDDRRMTSSGAMLVASAESPDAIEGYDVTTGAKQWRVLSDQGSAGIGFGKLSSDAELAYVLFSNGLIGAYDLQTGQRRSVRKSPVPFFTNAPLISRDTFFLGSWNAAFAVKR